MTDFQTIEELCRICDAQNGIIKAQAESLAQLNALAEASGETKIREKKPKDF